jgi:hypothetical protein
MEGSGDVCLQVLITRAQFDDTAAAVAAEKPIPAERSTLGATPSTTGRQASNVLYCTWQPHASTLTCLISVCYDDEPVTYVVVLRILHSSF